MHRISKEIYWYLCPVYGLAGMSKRKLLYNRGNEYYWLGDNAELQALLRYFN